MTKNNQIRILTTTALMTAVLCVLSPISLPIGPVPISLTNLALYFMIYVVGTRISFTSCLLFILLGLVGMPVFSGYTGGPQKLFGPTGGYIIGYLPMILIMGSFVKKHWQNRIACVAVMEAATWILYLLGTAWLSFGTGMSFRAALGAGVLPFIILDFMKMCAAAVTAPMICMRLQKAGVTAF
ncbi:MAG: biotin transporter BioY [Stomatobaculum sp.]|nr:biotin transporter BioY [Stomatobaculum sp.]